MGNLLAAGTEPSTSMTQSAVIMREIKELRRQLTTLESKLAGDADNGKEKGDKLVEV